jgi:arylsulfatase A-like enzyme
MTSTRVLIVVFDALRPEFVTPELMPRLSSFAANGVKYVNARSTYPTETRVNQSAVTTGCMPRRHGVVANKFMANDLLPGLLVNTGDNAELVEAMAKGPVLSVQNMGQHLTKAGLRYASLSAGTPGGGRLINWSAEEDGSFRLAMRAPEACTPRNVFERVTQRVGPLPDYILPAKAWISWAVDTYLDWIEPEVSPDAMLLWLCEPDESFHWKGIGSPAARETIAHVDAQFGGILDRLQREIATGEMQVIAMSDHGQITLDGDRMDIPALMQADGFRASTISLEDADYLVAVGNAGGIWAREPALVPALVNWLLAQDWCGPLFTKDGLPGTLSQSMLRLDHARAPDVSVILQCSDRENSYGVAGSTLHDAPYGPGGGCHGGLSHCELHNVLLFGGAAFRSGIKIEVPGGNIDVLPTVLNLLGTEVPSDIDGRILKEAMREGPDPASVVWEQSVLKSDAEAGRRTCLSISEVGSSRYLNQAWTEAVP